MNRNRISNIIAMAIVCLATSRQSTYGGDIKISASDYITKFVSSDHHHVTIKAGATVTVTASVDEGAVSVEYTCSDGISGAPPIYSDSGKIQTNVFSFADGCVGKENAITAEIAHDAVHTNANGEDTPCLEHNPEITYYVYIPKLVFNLDLWSTDNDSAESFNSTLGVSSAAIGHLTTANKDGEKHKLIPYEYIATVADPTPTEAGVSADRLDVRELASRHFYVYFKERSPNLAGPTVTEAFYRVEGAFGDDGDNAENPTRYSDDAPGIPKDKTEKYITDHSTDEDPVVKINCEQNLTSWPTLDRCDIGRSASHTFMATCEGVFSGTTLVDFNWY